ncbi:MAG: PLP-dependent aminotransferase family protein, partial [Opitutales bacterium]
SNYSQALIEQVLKEASFEQHLSDARFRYCEKAAQTDATLHAEGMREAGWSWDKPTGGFYFWLRGPDGLDVGIDSAFCRHSLENRVLYVPGDLCIAEGEPRNYIRLSFGSLEGDNLKEAIRRLVLTAKNIARA